MSTDRLVLSPLPHEGEGSEGVRTLSGILLQFELEGHAAWLKRSARKTDAFSSLVELTTGVRALLQQHSFSLVYWTGEGGVFALDAAPLSDFDCAVTAAQEVAALFKRWRGGSPHGAALRMRISLHHADPLYVHGESNYWSSHHLNAFSRNERQIGIAGAIAVTQSVHERLSEAMRARFPEAARRESLIGGVPGELPVISRIYYALVEDSDDAPQPHGASLEAWLRDLSGEMRAVTHAPGGPSKKGRVAVGDAILVKSINGPSDRLFTELQKTPPPLYALTESELEALRRAGAGGQQQEAWGGMEAREKVSPSRVILPQIDIPCITIEWHEETWSHTRAFHALLREDRELWGRLAKDALNGQHGGLPFPGILCAHIVVRVPARDGGEPLVLLCQRSPSGDRHYQGDWACSIEEQVRPGEDIEQCVRRAVGEELLGAGSNERSSAKVVAYFIEGPLLNSAMLVVVDIPMCYEEVLERWRRDAPDREEHSQIIGLPVRRDLLIACGRYEGAQGFGGLPPEVRGDCLVADREAFERTAKWDFHPTSLLRLAVVNWLGTS